MLFNQNDKQLISNPKCIVDLKKEKNV